MGDLGEESCADDELTSGIVFRRIFKGLGFWNMARLVFPVDGDSKSGRDFTISPWEGDCFLGCDWFFSFFVKKPLQ